MQKRFARTTATVALSAILAATLVGCGSSTTSTGSGTQSTGFQELTGDQLVAAAKKEGAIVSYGMPDDWANLKEIWSSFSTKYGVKHTDTDMSSAEELAKFDAEKTKAVADVGDIGIGFGAKAIAMGVVSPHKNPHWSEIPDWAKDPNGNWAAEYTGTMAFLVNTKLVPMPTTWSDLLKPEYKNAVVVSDPTKASQGQAAVLGAAVSFGGTESNIKPGLDFFAKLAKAGNLKNIKPDVASIQKGEVAVAILWDFNALGYKAQLKMDELKVVIPSEGSVTQGYVAVVNKYAPHPYTARLLNDYLFSDEAQIMYAKGFARPIRKVQLPADVAANMLPDSQYAKAQPIKDFTAWEQTVKQLPAQWQDQVLSAK